MFASIFILVLLFLVIAICVKLSKVKSHMGNGVTSSNQLKKISVGELAETGNSYDQNPEVVKSVVAPSKPQSEDIVDVTTVDGSRRFLLVRQFNDYDKLIIRIITADDVITDIRITAVTPYVYSNYKGIAFDLPSVSDFNKFAKHADDKLALCLQPLVDKGSDVTHVELSDMLLSYFDDRNMLVYGKFCNWERETRYIHQLGVKLSTFNNVVWLRDGTFKPADDSEVKVRIEYALDVLLCVNINVDRPNEDRNPLYRIKESLTIIDAQAAYALQKDLNVEPRVVYDVLTERYQPFGPEEICALREYLQQHNIDHIYDITNTKVEPHKLIHTIPVSRDNNLSESDGYVPYGSTSDYYVTIYHIEDIITKVEYEDKTVTSGYWHDNPNYPFSNISSKTVEITDSDQIMRLVHSLAITENIPESLLDRIKELFPTQNDFVRYLNSNQIKYTDKHAQ